MKKAIYPGSFDPITNGHIDIVTRASRIFDEILISIISNPAKNSLFSLDERAELISAVFKDNPKVRVNTFNGLLVDYVQTMDVYTIIRGIRAVSDFDYEFQLAITNRKLEPKIDTVFFMTDQQYSYLSSGLVKEINQFKGDISHFVPHIVADKLRNRS